MIKILVAEDDRAMNGLVSSCLRECGYEVKSCYDGEEALNAFAEGAYSMVLSDIMMPKLDGFALAENVRLADKNIPILFMTARDDLAAKQKGYRVGIDDYMTKPVDLDELLLHIGALLRRAKIASSKKLTIGDLVLDAEEHSVYWKDEEILLTVREFNLVYKLLSYPKKTFTRSQLMDEFWDAESSSGTRTVDVYMTKLRDKFSECDVFEIVTVHGLGYKAVLK